VVVHDPVVSTVTAEAEDAVAGADAVIVATNHSAFTDPALLRTIAERGAPDCLVVDPWNAFGAGQVFGYASELAALRPATPAG
jgi:UDP-N-acetyl-D-mannosaminuronic acid dehydrogenase